MPAPHLMWRGDRFVPETRQTDKTALVAYVEEGVYELRQWGHVAEWLRNGLQNRVHQFNSGRGLH
jgi:hypothetical protein